MAVTRFLQRETVKESLGRGAVDGPVHDERGTRSAGGIEPVDHAPVFQGDRDDLVPLVYPGEVPLYVGLAEDGVLALEFPEGRSRRGIQEETLVGEADEDWMPCGRSCFPCRSRR